MIYNDYTAAKVASLKSVEAGPKTDDGSKTYTVKTKRWDPNTGQAAADLQTAVTVAALEADKAALQAKIAEIDALLADIEKLV